MKQILFNTDMIRAILDGRKTQTRRIVAPHIVDRFVIDEDGRLLGSYMDGERKGYPTIDDAPHQEGDILYVRETWMPCASIDSFLTGTDMYSYKADWTDTNLEMQQKGWIGKDVKWRPSIHMPKEAARILLSVTGVRVEQLQDVSEEDAKAEGAFLYSPDFIPTYHYKSQDTHGNGWTTARECFLWGIWDKTLKRVDYEEYNHCANPWVWVYEFERVEAPNGKTTK